MRFITSLLNHASSVKVWLIIAAIGAFTAVGFGWWSYHAGVVAERERVELRHQQQLAERNRMAREQLERAMNYARQKDVEIRQIEQSHTAEIARLQTEIGRYERSYPRRPPQVVQPDQPHAVGGSELPDEETVRSVEPDEMCVPDRLSLGAVRMLNDAVSSTYRDSDSIDADGTGDAPSTVTRVNFLQWALGIIGRYNTLMRRYNWLLDEVEKAQDERQQQREEVLQ